MFNFGVGGGKCCCWGLWFIISCRDTDTIGISLVFIVLLPYLKQIQILHSGGLQPRFENKHARPDVFELFWSRTILWELPSSKKIRRLTKHDFVTMTLTKKCWNLRMMGATSQKINDVVFTVLLHHNPFKHWEEIMMPDMQIYTFCIMLLLDVPHESGSWLIPFLQRLVREKQRTQRRPVGTGLSSWCRHTGKTM